MLSDNTDENNNLISANNAINDNIQQKIDNLNDDESITFVDRSYSNNANGKEKYSFGAIIFLKNVKDTLYKIFVNNEKMQFKNISGEVEGVMQLFLWAIDNNKTKITIYYAFNSERDFRKTPNNIENSLQMIA